MRGSDETAGARFAVACAFNENAIWAMALHLSGVGGSPPGTCPTGA